MKKILYKCMNKECNHESIESRIKDGTNCFKCGSPIFPLRDATQEDITRIYKSQPPRNSMSITLTLDGYEKFKEQLKDIENHFDRIIEKQKLLRVPEAINVSANISLGNYNIDEIVAELCNSIKIGLGNIT